MKLGGTFALKLISVISILLGADIAISAGGADLRCDQILGALRDGNFSAATSHFDSTMKAGLSPDQLGKVWNQLLADNGKLQEWQIIQRERADGLDVLVAALTFEHGKMFSIVSVRPETDEVAGLFFKPAGAPAAADSGTSPPYSNLKKFYEEDAVVGTKPYELPGTLTIPDGTGPFPAAVLVHGSGPNDRDETLGPNHVFKDIAEGLSSRGIVVLRYDKRTYAYRSVVPHNIGVDDEVIQDAVAAVKLLRARSDVLGDRIFVIGHSLGATLTPEIAKKSWPVAGIVMLAPLGRNLPQVIVQQVRFLGQGSPAELAEIERKANQISAHKMPASETFLGASAAYYYDLDARDEVAIAETLDVPILILHGGRDYQVIDQDIQHWQDGLKGVAKVKVETFPQLNHLFIAGEGKPGPAEYQNPGHVDAPVIDAIANFIAAAGRKSKAATK